MIKIICIGKIKEKYLTELINDYLTRTNKYHKIEIIELQDTNKKEEGIKILSKLSNKSYKVALTIDGERLTSPELSKFIETKLMNYSNIDFIIGGSEGLDEQVLKQVDYKLSFSPLTFPHGLFRGILLEQIYRSFKIINNETYHKWG